MVRFYWNSYPYKRLLAWALLCTSLMLTGGCIIIEPKPNDPFYAPVNPAVLQPQAPTAGSVLSLGHEPYLYQDIKARRVGDILTVMFDEQMTANKENSSDASKNSTVELPKPTVLGKMLQFDLPFLNNLRDLTLDVDGNTKRNFQGAASSEQKNKLDGTMSVTVTQVLPNGNLIVRGEKWLNLNQGDEFIRLTGLVRSKDVAPDNVVLSSRIADARIAYSGVGVLNESNQAGWLYRTLSSVFWPL